MVGEGWMGWREVKGFTIVSYEPNDRLSFSVKVIFNPDDSPLVRELGAARFSFKLGTTAHDGCLAADQPPALTLRCA